MGNHPELAVAGWFAKRWSDMDASEQLEWVKKHDQQLRDLWLEGGGAGFEAHGLELPMRLAKIDA